MSIEMNTRPNLTTPSMKPDGGDVAPRHAAGGLTKSTAGMATSVKRSAENSRGGKWSSPTWMATKFTPQMKATSDEERDGAGGHAVHPAARDGQERVDIPRRSVRSAE